MEELHNMPCFVRRSATCLPKPRLPFMVHIFGFMTIRRRQWTPRPAVPHCPLAVASSDRFSPRSSMSRMGASPIVAHYKWRTSRVSQIQSQSMVDAIGSSTPENRASRRRIAWRMLSMWRHSEIVLWSRSCPIWLKPPIWQLMGRLSDLR